MTKLRPSDLSDCGFTVLVLSLKTTTIFVTLLHLFCGSWVKGAGRFLFLLQGFFHLLLFWGPYGQWISTHLDPHLSSVPGFSLEDEFVMKIDTTQVPPNGPRDPVFTRVVRLSSLPFPSRRVVSCFSVGPSPVRFRRPPTRVSRSIEVVRIPVTPFQRQTSQSWQDRRHPSSASLPTHVNSS